MTRLQPSRIRVLLTTACLLSITSAIVHAQDDEAGAASDSQQHIELRDRYHQQMKSAKGPDGQALRTVGEELKQLFATTDDDEVKVMARMDAYAVDVALARLLVQKSQFAFEAAEKETTLQQARRFYGEAATLADETSTLVESQLQSAQAARDEEEVQRKLKSRLVQVQLSRASIAEETAGSYPEDDAKRKQLLQQAKTRYEDVHNRNRTSLAGVYAQMYQGRVGFKLKEFDECVAIFESLLRLPSKPVAFEVVKLKVSVLLADSRLEQEDADLHAEGKRIRKHLRALPESLRERSDARKLRERLQQIESKTSSDQAAAGGNDELQMIEIGSEADEEELTPAEKAKVAEYRLAHAKVREKMAKYQTAKELLNTLQLKLEAAEADAAREQAQQAVDDAQAAAKQLLPDTITACGQMLELGDAESSHRPTSVPLYYLSYLHVMTDDYATALLYGEDLARNQPMAYGARQAAKISAACYLKKVGQAIDPAEKSNMLRQYVEMEMYTVKTWPESKEAQEAIKRLTRFREAARAAKKR